MNQKKSLKTQRGVWGPQAPGNQAQAAAFADTRTFDHAPCEACPPECKVGSYSRNGVFGAETHAFSCVFGCFFLLQLDAHKVGTVGVTAAAVAAITADEPVDLYYSLRELLKDLCRKFCGSIQIIFSQQSLRTKIVFIGVSYGAA
jgi:hypothetical protein